MARPGPWPLCHRFDPPGRSLAPVPQVRPAAPMVPAKSYAKSYTAEEYRQRIAEMVHDIEVETARRIFLTGKVPRGPEAIRQQHPHERAVRPKKSPAPFCHAFSKEAREQLREAYRLFVEAYRSASAQLRSGDRSAKFPEGCFPPALPFIRNDA